MDTTATFEGKASWQKIVAVYSKPNLRKSIWQTVKPLTLLESLKSLKWRVYDEANHQLAGWGVLKQMAATSAGNRNVR